MEMTANVIRKLCKEHKLYQTPHLNDTLYLHYKGFPTISALEEYCNLKALYLEGNALLSFEGLPPLPELKCLFAQQNLLTSLFGLGNAPGITNLNIASNSLDSLKGIGACPHISTLSADGNHISTSQGIQPILDCQELQTLDLQRNEIEDPAVVSIFQQLPQLRCLYLKGNPVVSKIKNYRKVLISSIPTLTYLDDRPVDEQERRCAVAWAEGGLDAERQARQKFQEEQASQDRRNFEFISNLRKSCFRERRRMLGLPDGDTDPMLDGLSSGGDDGEDDSASCVSDQDMLPPEPPELLAARAALAAYTPGPQLGRPGAPAQSAVRAAQETVWQETSASADQGPANTMAVATSDDAAVYFASVQSAQEELDAEGLSLMVSELGAVAPLPGMGQQPEAAAEMEQGTDDKTGASKPAAAAEGAEECLGGETAAASAQVGVEVDSTSRSMPVPAGSGAAAAFLAREARPASNSMVEDNQRNNTASESETGAGAALPCLVNEQASPSHPGAEMDNSARQPAQQRTSLSVQQDAEQEPLEGTNRGMHEEVVSPEDVIIAGAVDEGVVAAVTGGSLCGGAVSGSIDLLELD